MIFSKSRHRGIIDLYLPVLLHGLGWVAYMLAVYNGNSAGHNFFEFSTHYGPKFIFQAMIFYINYLYLIPVALAKLKILRYISLNMALVLLLGVCLATVHYPNTNLNQFPFLKNVWIDSLNITWFLTLSILIRFSTDWFRQKQLEKERENQQLKSELDFLKAQVNPHFFFNSLNNLYALSLKQAPETPETILRISRIMRYLLYETDVKEVPLAHEAEMIATYVSLQQLKNKSGENISMEIIGDLGSIQVEPLLLLPIIENIFKHGIEPINIELQVSPLIIQLKTINKIRNSNEKIAGGIGLANLKRRLTLLYPNAHQLELQKNDDNFTATLILNLQSR
jgi:two-component system LytT family sensor kinase